MSYGSTFSRGTQKNEWIFYQKSDAENIPNIPLLIYLLWIGTSF